MKKSASKSAKKSPAVSAKKPVSASTRARVPQDAVIVKVAKTNPRKEGTYGFKSFSLIKSGMPVSKFVANGGRMVDLRWDVEKGNLKLKKAA